MLNDLILHYSDTHIRDMGSFPPYNQIASNGLSKELNNIIVGYKFVRDKILEHKPKLVINHGDVVHITEFQSAQVIHGISVCFDLIKSACDEVGSKHILFPGNHDILSCERNITNIGILKYYVDKLITTPEIFSIDGFDVGVIPYSNKDIEISHCLTNYDKDCDIIAAHLDIKGCVYESGMESTTNLVYKGSTPLISGDIHLPQDFSHVHYIGSLVQHKFNISHLDKVGGILITDMNTKNITRISNNYSKHYVRVRDSNIESALRLDPNRCLLQIISTFNKDKIDDLFKGFEYHYLPDVRQCSNELKIYHKEFNLADPELILRNWIQEERSEALDEYDSIMGSSK